ncbi:hypothetical protein DFP73DRAFT_552138 [Morchella snyderi]|nr:hypothetical protein DFP73DRAFT_552138 [Morchella snyderi]
MALRTRRYPMSTALIVTLSTFPKAWVALIHNVVKSSKSKSMVLPGCTHVHTCNKRLDVKQHILMTRYFTLFAF